MSLVDPAAKLSTDLSLAVACPDAMFVNVQPKA